MKFATLATIHELLVNNVDKKKISYSAAHGAYKAYFNSHEVDDDRAAELRENELIAYRERSEAYDALEDFETHEFR